MTMPTRDEAIASQQNERTRLLETCAEVKAVWIDDNAVSMVVDQIERNFRDAFEDHDEFVTSAILNPGQAVEWGEKGVQSSWAIQQNCKFIHSISVGLETFFESVDELQDRLVNGYEECLSTCGLRRGAGEYKAQSARYLLREAKGWAARIKKVHAK